MFCKRCKKNKKNEQMYLAYNRSTKEYKASSICKECHVIASKIGIGKRKNRNSRNYQDTHGTIYFVQAKELKKIKIGFTTMPTSKRLKTLQGCSPDEIVLLCEMKGSLLDEKMFHEKFAYCNSHFEWYHPDSKLLEYIEILKLNNRG